MKKLLFSFLLICCLATITSAQPDTISSYTRKTYMIPKRDGVMSGLGFWGITGLIRFQ